MILKLSRNRTIQNVAMTETQCSPPAALEFNFLTTYFNTTFISVCATAGKGEKLTIWCLKGQDTKRTKYKNGLSLRSSIHNSKWLCFYFVRFFVGVSDSHINKTKLNGHLGYFDRVFEMDKICISLGCLTLASSKMDSSFCCNQFGYTFSALCVPFFKAVNPLNFHSFHWQLYICGHIQDDQALWLMQVKQKYIFHSMILVCIKLSDLNV